MFKKYASGVGVALGFSSGIYVTSLELYKEKLEPLPLNTIENRFSNFADVKKDEKEFMSPSSFIKSILVPKPKLPSWVAHPRKNGKLISERSLEQNAKLQKLLSMADANSDGLISFQEYQLFLTLLTSTSRKLQLAFKVIIFFLNLTFLDV